jgi:aspartate aminotransferase
VISSRAKSLKPSPTLALAAKAKELAAQGHDVISLSVGEPDWDTLECAKQAGIAAIQKGFSKYTPSNGIVELRKAIANQTSKDIGLNYSPDEVTVSTGGKFVIFAALQMVLDPGDEVIIPAPYWVSYPVMVELAGGVSKIAVCDETVNFKLTPEILRKNLSSKTKVLILNSPSNPTGLAYSREELAALARVLADFPQVLILSDDIYNRLYFASDLAPHILQVAPELKGRTLVMNGASKTYAMTGWRVGWALGPMEWIKAMTNYQSQSVSQAATMSQWATLGAIEQGSSELKTSLAELKIRRDRGLQMLRALPDMKVSEPDGAFYFWPDVRPYLGRKYQGEVLKTASDFSNLLLSTQKVAVVPGNEFGLEGYVRLSFALKQERMAQAFDRIKTFISQLT